jgi:mono/diheme cytochrome c family protein
MEMNHFTLAATAVIASFGVVGPTHAVGDVRAGKVEAAGCAACHGTKGWQMKPVSSEFGVHEK